MVRKQQVINAAQPSATLGARHFFDGFMQQAQVQRWANHSGHGIND